MMERILRIVGDFDRFGGKDRKGPFVPVKVAVVHEWLVTWAGAERVLAEILGLFPQADLFVLFDRLSPDQRGNLPRDPVGETFLTRIPRVGRIYRNLLPLMPLAIESLNLKDYDLVLSSSHAVAKGLLPHPGQLHLCYCHTPPPLPVGHDRGLLSPVVFGVPQESGGLPFPDALETMGFRCGPASGRLYRQFGGGTIS